MFHSAKAATPFSRLDISWRNSEDFTVREEGLLALLHYCMPAGTGWSNGIWRVLKRKVRASNFRSTMQAWWCFPCKEYQHTCYACKKKTWIYRREKVYVNFVALRELTFLHSLSVIRTVGPGVLTELTAWQISLALSE